MLPIAVQPSISTIHCKCLYSLANPVLAFPMFSSPNTSPTPSCPRTLCSNECHPEQSEGSAFLLFIRLARLPSFGPSLGRSLVCTEPRRATNPFVIRTYEKTGVGGRIPSETSQSWLSLFQVPRGRTMLRRYRCTAAGKVPESLLLLRSATCWCHTGNISAPGGV